MRELPETFGDTINEFMVYQTSQVMLGNHSKHTLNAYQQDLETIRRVLGNTPLAELDQAAIDSYYIALGKYTSKRTGKKLSPHTINKRLRTLRRLLNFCKDRGYIQKPPHVQIIKAEVDLDKKTIPIEDLQRILWHAQRKRLNRERDTFIVIALMDFGARSAEIASLRIHNIDQKKRLVTIWRKGGRKQTVPVSGQFIQALNAWLAVRPLCDHDFVLCATNDSEHPPLTSTALGQAFRRLAKRATGHSRGPHSVRHCWITEMLNNTDTPPKVVQDIAGHRAFRTTEQYVRPDLSSQRRAIERHQLAEFPEEGHEEITTPAPPGIYLN